MKTFLNFDGPSLLVERNKQPMELVVVQQSKGTKGKYPGLNGGMKLDELSEFIGGPEKFDQWVAKRFNEETSLLWRECCEELSLEKNSTPSAETRKALTDKFSSYLNDMLDGKRTSERDASKIAAEIIRCRKEYDKAVEEKKTKEEVNEIRAKHAALKEEYKAILAAQDEAIAGDLV